MSLGVAIKGPEGIVLAADSRITLEANQADSNVVIPVTFDNASKLLTFDRPDLGVNNPHRFVSAITYGTAVIGTQTNDLRTAHSYIPELIDKLGGARKTTSAYASHISDFFSEQWAEKMPDSHQSQQMTFVVCGIDEGEAYGRVFLFEIPRRPTPVERNAEEFGITWGGQLEFATRLLFGFDPKLPNMVEQSLGLDQNAIEKLHNALEPLTMPVPYSVLPLQDCIDLATFLIKMTMQAQSLAIGVRGVGGPIDVATITRTEGLRFIRQKVSEGH